MNIRQLISGVLVGRSRFANVAGLTFGGRRDIYKTLGYQRELFPIDYRSRFERNGVANRVVKALPKATWRGGAELIEDQDPTKETEFETAFETLNERLKVWSVLQQADILAGIAQYAVVLIGAPGKMEEPLVKCSAEDILYLRPYMQEDAKVYKFDIDPTSPRFGQPILYMLTRTTMLSPESTNSNVIAKQVHWTRILHIADGLLDDTIYGEPRLRCVWNYLDDLEKITGGGAEAFWKRADQGHTINLDPTMDLTPEEVAEMDEEVEKWEHDLKRTLRVRGAEVKAMGSDVADFQNQVNSIIALISASTGIPQRVLMGSEQGKLAAKMDRSNWDDRVADRRDDFAGPYVVRPFIDRLISLGALPTPESYDVQWGQLKILDDEQRAVIATSWAGLNQLAGETVVTGDEIREHVLDLEPLADVTDTPGGIKQPNPSPDGTNVDPEGNTDNNPAGGGNTDDNLESGPTAAKRKGVATQWAHVHQVADRFRGSRSPRRKRRVLRGS